MPRSQFSDVVLTNAGVPISGASVSVKDVDEDGAQGGDATIYTSETGGTRSNPFTTGADGYVEFWANAGDRYNVIISAAGFTTRTIRFEAGWAYTTPAAEVVQFPIGGVFDWPWGSGSLTAEFSILYGQAISRSTYSDLNTKASAASYPHGAGNGSTTFNVPDYRGRVGFGIDNMGGSAASRVTSGGSGITGTTLGASGGAETVTLTTATMPAHSHGTSESAHTHVVSDPGHTHLQKASTALTDDAGDYWNTGNTGAGYDKGGTTQSATTGVTVGTASTGLTVSSAGSGGAHNNMPPAIMVYKVMRLL